MFVSRTCAARGGHGGQVFGLVSNVLNDRMRSKIAVLPAGGPFSQLRGQFNAAALHSYGELHAVAVDWSADVSVANGDCELMTRWLLPGETLGWSVRLVEGGGDNVRVYAAWVAASDGGDGGEASAADDDDEPSVAVGSDVLQDVALKAAETCDGRFTATGARAGVLWLCVDNTSSWWHPRTVRVTVTHEANGNASPVAVG